MIGVVYLGNNTKTQERLKYIPGRLVKMTTNYKDAAIECNSHTMGENVIVFYERGVRNEDITAITYIRKKCKNVYIVLLTGPLTEEDRKAYNECGINDTLEKEASVTELNKKILFISERENILFNSEEPKHKILRFKIPFWKRSFDIIFSLISIIILSPIFILTIIAIRLESKGPILFKSKRVGTNYTIFDFLKFRSMFTDADKRLKELSKSHNQYSENNDKKQASVKMSP